ncbi:ClpXP adapter SpxH family protein [Flavobacterium ardleyense]|uniref:ClpXP adapter SpxH family protein n=1 Tax=Flavobacterium ardleyense TaxID=2038737 RepID=UPI00298BCA1D|nr:ClpXP adapter SpxH family protein [Flavobacterium ardleyense]
MKNDDLNVNPLICDIETGMCEIDLDSKPSTVTLEETFGNRSLKLIYFTDPICSSCWGIEPQLRKLKLEYGNSIEVEYRMGGLLPDWNYNSGGIGKPSDVASHWDEVSVHYDMPIDGDLWLEDPLDSSYPPSIAFKAAEMQSKEKALLFLREMKEMVFLHKKNIAKWEILEVAAAKAGLNTVQLKADFEGEAKNLFEKDLLMAREMGVRGFPTIFVVDTKGKQEQIYGTKPYIYYEMALLKLNPELVKAEYSKDWKSLFEKFPTFTAKEFSELSGMPRGESERYLTDLSTNGQLEKFTTKNGSIWTLIK